MPYSQLASAQEIEFEDSVIDGMRNAPAAIRIQRRIDVPVLPHRKKKMDFVVLPIPVVDPQLGGGVAPVGALLYRIGDSKKPSFSGLGGFYLSSGSYGAGFAQQAYLWRDRIRFNIAAGYAQLNYDFFGIGNAAARRGISLPIEQAGQLLMAKVYYQALTNIYVGLRYRYLRSNLGIRNEGTRAPLLTALLARQLNIRIGGLGPVAYLDTRDDTFYPTKGWFVDFSSFIARGDLGNSRGIEFSYERIELAINKYWALDDRRVIAGRLSFCGTTGSSPFFDLCSFGSNNDLRGYETGRYRDRRMFALQAEYRWRFYKRFTFTAFAGFGGVARTIDRFRVKDFLPAGGIGFRYQASKEFRLNISVDIAGGRNGAFFYVRLGEAF